MNGSVVLVDVSQTALVSDAALTPSLSRLHAAPSTGQMPELPVPSAGLLPLDHPVFGDLAAVAAGIEAALLAQPAEADMGGSSAAVAPPSSRQVRSQNRSVSWGRFAATCHLCVYCGGSCSRRLNQPCFPPPATLQLLAVALAQHPLPNGSRALAGHRLLDQVPQKISTVQPAQGAAPAAKAAEAAAAAAAAGWQPLASRTAAPPASAAVAPLPAKQPAAAAVVPAMPAALTPPAMDEASLRRALVEDCAVPLSYLRSLLFA